jgi:hypothetical protein
METIFVTKVSIIIFIKLLLNTGWKRMSGNTRQPLLIH